MTICRLIIYPLLAIVGSCMVFRVYPADIDPVVYYIIVLGASAPTATVVMQLAQMADLDSGYASSLNVLTTLCSIVTMPLMMMAAQVLL
ncbi:MAG: hypothetical protein IKV59_05725 [Lachnospiraceae bacterium]|nr:hypothetical protein [Lachnospiraceae bacterium]